MWLAGRRNEPATVGDVLVLCRAHGAAAMEQQHLGETVLVGNIPGVEMGGGWAFRTRSNLVPTPPALQDAGLTTDMVCWPVRRGDFLGGVTQAPARVGRAPSNEIALAHQDVSKLHALVWQRGEQLALEDARSLNGTYINGIRLPLGGRGTALPGDTVAFGPVALRVMNVQRLMVLLATL